MSLQEEAAQFVCAACGGQLAVMKVGFSYLKGNFEVDLPACPGCGLVLVSEALALGKMADAERILEDK